MFLAVYVYRRLGLTIDLTENHPLVPESAVHEGPAFDRLTANPDNLRDSEKLNDWLAGFLPENGAIAPYQIKALEAWRALDTSRQSVAGILWGNADAEYTGAIDFRQSPDRNPPERLPARPPDTHEPITAREIGRRLELSTDVAKAASLVRPDDVLALYGRQSSLSGMRGKLCLTDLGDERWAVATGDSLNTWICKHEQHPRLPAHAVIESICQRTLQLVDVPAADTTARVFDGAEAVLSRRTDRIVSAAGTIEGRHQEEWVQAACIPPYDKYGSGPAPLPGWPHAYELLANHAPDPVRARYLLTRAVVATSLLCHADMHRRNVGFRHETADHPPGIDIAPLYDVASSAGVPFSRTLAIPINGKYPISDVTPHNWMLHSDDCGVPREITLAVIEQLHHTLPDAVATARAEAATTCETLHEQHVDPRTDAIIRHIRGRISHWKDRSASLAKRRSPGFEPHLRQAADALRKALADHPDGTISRRPAANASGLRITYTPPEGEPIAIGDAANAREAALIEALAGAARPDDIPRLERALENERRQTPARGPDRD